jgi:hypothetical protein
MSTWNAITIENPGALTIDTLPDALTRDGEIWEGYEVTDERIDVPERRTEAFIFPGRPGNPDGNFVIAGGSKWRADEAIAALMELSKTTGRITHHQEWDDDTPGAETTVYVNGEYVEAESLESAMVPANLAQLVAEVRKYVRRDHRGDIYTSMGAEPMRAVMALVDALDPKGAQK